MVAEPTKRTRDPASNLASTRVTDRTSNTSAGLLTATPIIVTVPSYADMDSVNVGDLFEANGEENARPFVQVTATLFASSDRLDSPTLYSFEFSYECAPIE